MENKNSTYTFRVEQDCKDKFKIYCKIMNVSPSDVLTEVMRGFNSDAEKIIKMQNISELQEMFRQKVLEGQKELDVVVEHPTFKR